ncbi:CaiB/BaiF CoA transferase family protein [Burkholderia pseudomallei]|uniref:CaiB/BaiF CoA transferase family protein n=3 Tax=Burkholderia pseudomallei TaxID=28450 RepID=UPI00040AE9AD|nr:CaiB/BaiF CoA-transferase family protein [Burkholderia pseudomallei]AIP47285.1 coA-transferase III family protein [Burkholderia pseudomallei MSHR5858]MBM5627505.1 CoA transferase [Burkholderia pseudomallei]
MRNEPGARPLAGIKVLDFSRVLAGPWCAMVLADLGAEVIKIEHPRRGDDTRDWGLRVGDTETTYFNSVNRSKRSICVDLQTQAGRRIARELAAQADVVVHNFKAGGAEKLGLGYDALAALNPRLVHCAISGYDRSGPEAGRPGYDLVVQGEAGLMALNGEAGRPPLKFGVAVADLFTGMYSAQAILAALYERHATGRGRRIEMALFDCGLMVTSYYGLEALLMGEDPPRYGNAHPSIVPYGVFDAADGPIVITVGNNPQFARFCDVIGRPELAADARFATNIARSANRAALLPEILRELGRRPRAALLAALAALADAGIPCGEVLGLREALTSERARSAGLVTRQPHPVAGEVDVLAPPYRFDGERLPVRGAPPVLGADTDRVLGEWLGMSGREIAQLRSERVV